MRSSLVLVEAAEDGRDPASRELFSGLGRFDGPVFSPNGERIQLGLRDLDQWVFVSPKRGVDPIAVGDISRQFEPGGGGARRRCRRSRTGAAAEARKIAPRRAARLRSRR